MRRLWRRQFQLKLPQAEARARTRWRPVFEFWAARLNLRVTLAQRDVFINRTEQHRERETKLSRAELNKTPAAQSQELVLEEPSRERERERVGLVKKLNETY